MEESETGSASKGCAWVALVMGLDQAYVGAALVLASSLKRHSKRGDLVCMVTPDVPAEARSCLAAVYDSVVEVPYLQTLALQKYSERFDAMYNYWLDKCFTKVSVFNLTEYSKVVFLDADMLAVAPPDELFELSAPAGICSAVRDIEENERLHGHRLPRGAIEESLRNGQGRYGVRGCLLVVEPDKETYSKIKGIVEGVDRYGNLDSMVGPDEYLVTRFFENKWSHVHAKFGWVSWADRQDLGVEPVFLHYVSQKPWDEGEEWEDFQYWKKEAGDLVRQEPKTLCYFGRLINDVGKMAEVEVTPEITEKAEKLKELSEERRVTEKARREASASSLGVDLTASASSSGAGAPGTPGVWRAPPNTRPVRPIGARTPRTSPRPPPSARDRSTERNGGGGLVVKANSNILVVHNFRRPYPSKAEEKKPNGKSGSQTPRLLSPRPGPTPPKLGGKGMVIPRLNLATLNADDNSSPADDSAGKSGKTWMADHWRKRHGGDPDTHRSAADMDDNWRQPSARAPPEVDEEPQQQSEGQNSAAVPQSARPWQAQTTPASARGQGSMRSARSFYQRWDNPPLSSRADQVTSWRSTPRDVVDSAGSWRGNSDQQEKQAESKDSNPARGPAPSGADHGSRKSPVKQVIQRTPRNQIPKLSPNIQRFSPRDFRHDPPANGPYSARYSGNGKLSPPRGKYRGDGGAASARLGSGQGGHRHDHSKSDKRHEGQNTRTNGSTRYSAGGKEGGFRGGRRDAANRSSGNRGTYGSFERREHKGQKGEIAGPNSRNWTAHGSAGMSKTEN